MAKKRNSHRPPLVIQWALGKLGPNSLVLDSRSPESEAPDSARNSTKPPPMYILFLWFDANWAPDSWTPDNIRGPTAVVGPGAGQLGSDLSGSPTHLLLGVTFKSVGEPD